MQIIDGHNDTLLRLYKDEQADWRDFLTGMPTCQVDLPRAKAGGMGAAFFAAFTPHDPRLPRLPDDGLEITADGYTMPLPPSLDPLYALRTTLAVLASLFRIEAASEGQVRVVRDVARLRECLADGAFGAIAHIEGADLLDAGGNTLEVLYQAGVRSLGLVWSRANRFGEGVPFRQPSSPDTGPGLTEDGNRLVRDCNRLGILIDLSHLNERGFDDVARVSDAPLVATHSGVHAITPTSRNLTDRQLDAIGASGGIVGIPFDVSMVRPDGHLNRDTPLDIIAAQIDYVVDRIGIEHVCLGSDFDGAVTPHALADASYLPDLLATLRARGHDDASLRQIASENWLRVLGRTWRA